MRENLIFSNHKITFFFANSAPRRTKNTILGFLYYLCAMIYPENFESKIGFDTIRREIERRCVSPLGLAWCDSMAFSAVHAEVVAMLERVDEFLSILQSRNELALNQIFDMRAALKSAAAPGSYITAEQFFQIQRSLATVKDVRRFFEPEERTKAYPRLAHLARGMNDQPELTAEIAQVLDKFGNVKDNASPELYALRTSLQSLTASLTGIMRRVMAQAKQDGLLDNDAQPSVRDGRLVLPVAPMHKRKLRGIVHDESASGKTVFIEPEQIVEANNRIRETEADIAREIIRILTALTDQVRPLVPEMLDTYDLLGRFDFIRAKALFARDIDAQMPTVEPKPGLEWYHAVHPTLLLSLREQGKEVVPLNITLDENQRIVLISGPNAGGKSVCLKTVGVVQYMAQCGVMPALHDNSHVGIFDKIFIDIGDQQSIEDDLSTYSSHLQNMKFFINHSDSHTLMLIDEFGSGTEPQIGGAIAQAILEKFNSRQVYSVITTHYQNLKHFAEQAEGIVNGAMLYDRGRMQPLFQLSIGYPGSSFAIEIARKIGLDHDVIDKAAEIVGSDYINMDRYLLDLVRDRRYWQNKRRDIRQKEKRLDDLLEQYNGQIDSLAEQRRAIIHQAKAEARQIVETSNARIEQTIRSIRETQAEKEKTKEVRRQLEEFKQRLEGEADSEHDVTAPLPKKRQPRSPRRKTEAERPQPTGNAPLQPGDNVLLEGQQTVGTVIAVEGKSAVVAFGVLKTRVELGKLTRTMKKPASGKASSVSRATSDDIRDRQLHFKPEIDVRGMRGDEALQAITYFIDDAIQFDHKRVRILHGTGTGALRQLLRQYLDTVQGVRSYHDEHVQFGGAGITVVNLE